ISEKEWHDTLLRSWLELSSKGGFKNFPQAKKQPKLSLKNKIEIKSAGSILWSDLKSESKTIYAFQGKLIKDKPSINLIKLIKALNSGKVCLISDYIKLKDLTALQALACAGAFHQL
ncbi:MAG: hypothetical protein H7235_09895, partial [Bdellovibrionaceae bacterium]|nr:hypothetical protein [Pseudobdellovibrionaceae bacterium]